MTQEEVVSSVVDQLNIYGKVERVGDTEGIFTDPAKNVWTWSVLLGTVTLSKTDFRPRHVSYENVSQYMFNWLYDDEECRPFLEFSLGLAEVVWLFGHKGAHEAFLKGGRSGVLRQKRKPDNVTSMGRASGRS